MAGMDTRAIIVAIVVGVIAGWLASLVVGGGGLTYCLVIGPIGSYECRRSTSLKGEMGLRHPH